MINIGRSVRIVAAFACAWFGYVGVTNAAALLFIDSCRLHLYKTSTGQFVPTCLGDCSTDPYICTRRDTEIIDGYSYQCVCQSDGVDLDPVIDCDAEILITSSYIAVTCKVDQCQVACTPVDPSGMQNSELRMACPCQ